MKRILCNRHPKSLKKTYGDAEVLGCSHFKTFDRILEHEKIKNKEYKILIVGNTESPFASKVVLEHMLNKIVETGKYPLEIKYYLLNTKGTYPRDVKRFISDSIWEENKVIVKHCVEKGMLTDIHAKFLME